MERPLNYRGTWDWRQEEKAPFSRDASMFEVWPEVVTAPESVADLKILLQAVRTAKQAGEDVSLTMRAGGTCMSGGPLSQSIVVDLSRYLTGVGELQNDGQSVWVDGGVMHLQVEELAATVNRYFAPFTSSRDICGIGGMIGNNASGEHSLKYGPTSKNVLRMRVLLADGNEIEVGPVSADQLDEYCARPGIEGDLYRRVRDITVNHADTIAAARLAVPKNAAGYNIWDVWNADRTELNLVPLFVGAQGTLGVTTAAELLLTKKVAYQEMLAVPVATLEHCAPIVLEILKHDPEVCETFDHHTYALAEKVYPEHAAKAIMAKGMPMLIFTVLGGDNPEAVHARALELQSRLQSQGFASQFVDADAHDSFLLIRRKSFQLLRTALHESARALPFLEDTIVPIERYGEFLARLEPILTKRNLTYTYAGHIGEGSIRLIPLVDVEQPDAPEQIFALAEEVYRLVVSLGGSISVDHNDGLVRTEYLSLQYPPVILDFFEQIKAYADPENIWNPGKKVNGNLDFAKSHVIRTNS